MTELIDAQAYFFVQGLLFLALPLTAWSILAGRHDSVTVALWCLSGLAGGLAFVLVGLRGRVPEALGYPVAVALGYGAYLLRGAALQRELGQRPRWMTMALICVAATVGFEMALRSGRDTRELYGAGIRLVAALWLAWLAFALARRERTRSAALLGAVFVLSIVASSVRMVTVINGWGDDHVPTALDYGFVNVAALLTALYANLGYVGLVLEREQAQRVQAEQHVQVLDALRAERRETLNESTPAMLHSIDVRGHLLAVSDTWLSRLGYARSEVIGRLSSDFLTAASQVYARQVVLPEFFRTGRCENISYQMVRKDGSVLDVVLSAVLEVDPQGRPLRSIAVIEDVTEKLARNAELAREHALRLQLEQRSRELDALLTERSEMLRVLAHEVRQPLHNASAALQSAAGVLDQSREGLAADRLRRAQSVLDGVLGGLNNTLAAAALLAGSGSAASEDIDLDVLIQIALGDIGADDRDRVQVRRATPTRTAAMDPGLMRLALRNLLHNALSYSPPGSPVTLHIADSDRPLALVLDVIDKGAGIEVDLQPRLFQRGERGVQGGAQPGSGLGLYIVRRVAEMHHGSVAALPGVGGGTVMRLTIPQGLPVA